MTTPRIVIVGAGLGGLTAGLALLKRGFDVEIYEQAPNLKEIGAGVQLSANGTRVLIALGLDAEIARIGTVPTSKEVRLWNTGKSWRFIDLASSVEKYGAPYYAMHRADLQDKLAKAVRREKPDAIHLGARFTAFKASDRDVTIQFDGAPPLTAELLIGADGIHSKIRGMLFGPDKAKFSGHMAWRAVIPTANLPPSILRDGGAFWVGAGAHVVHYPIRSGTMINFIGIVERSDWTIESWTETGTIAELSRDYAGWHDDIQAMIHDIDGVPYKWALLYREPIERWSAGRVTLLGDAAHATLPFLAQGANMAIEDGYVLARAVAQYGVDIAVALRAYEAARTERTARVIRVSAEQASRVHNPILLDPAKAEAHVAQEWEKNKVSDRYDWIYGHDALTAPV